MKKIILLIAVSVMTISISLACGDETKKACCKKGNVEKACDKKEVKACCKKGNVEKACAQKNEKACAKKSRCCKAKKETQEIKSEVPTPAYN